MQLFRNVIDECGFLDLSFVGSPYTWQKHFADGHSIWERLNRGIATNEWLMKFPRTRIHHLTSDSTDHCPLWIVPEGLEVTCPNKPFLFEEMWLLDPGCSNMVEAVWSSNDLENPSVKVVRKIEKCGKELKRWDRDHFRNVRRELAKKRRLLVEAEKEARRTGINHCIRELKREISELIEKENRMWFNVPNFYGQRMETRIQNSSIAMPPKGRERI